MQYRYKYKLNSSKVPMVASARKHMGSTGSRVPRPGWAYREHSGATETSKHDLPQQIWFKHGSKAT